MAKLAFIWDGKRCTYNGQTDPLKPGKPIAFKARFHACLNLAEPMAPGPYTCTRVLVCITQELRKLWDSRDTGGLFGPDNTLLIDDSTYKVSEREERTLACYVMALHTGSHTAAHHTHRPA